MSRFDAVEEKQGVDQFGIPVLRHLVYDGEASSEAGIIAICPDRDSALHVQQALERLHECQGSFPSPEQPPAFHAAACPVEVVYGSVEIKEADAFCPPPMPRPIKPWDDPDYMKWIGDTNWMAWRDELMSNPYHVFCKDDNHAYNGPNGLCSRCGWDEVPF